MPLSITESNFYAGDFVRQSTYIFSTKETPGSHILLIPFYRRERRFSNLAKLESDHVSLIPKPIFSTMNNEFLEDSSFLSFKSLMEPYSCRNYFSIYSNF